MKFPSYGVVGVLAACLLSTSALANRTGVTGYSGKSAAATCSACHTGTNKPTVEISGPTSLAAGASGQYSVIMRGGPGAVGGTDIAVSNTAAALDPVTGSGLKKVGTELTHSAPKAFNTGEVRFDFTMTAPGAAGTVTLYAAGNSANGNNSDDSVDSSATTKLDVTITSGTGGGTDAGTGGGTDAGTGNNPGNGDDNGGGCSSTGGAPVLAFVLAAASVALLRRRQS